MSEHVPAWKRFQIKKTDEGKKAEEELDSLIVSTHLSTGSLSKKEKKRIIRGDDVSQTKNKVSKQSKGKKREKLARDERLKKKETVLKDQLRYLIDFYTLQCELELPEAVKELPSVKENIALGSAAEDKNVVKDVWKFSKQKQNWLIKHILSLDELPSVFNPLVIKYFEDLKGGSKTQMIEQCLDIVNKHNTYLQKQKQEMANIVLNEPKKDAPVEDSIEKDEKNEESDDDQESKNPPEAEELNLEQKNVELLPPSKELLDRVCTLLDVWKVTFQIDT